MKATKIIIIALLANIFLAYQLFAQYNKENLQLEHTSVQKDFTYKNLQLYPIYANENFRRACQHLGNYISLKNAIENRKVIISEQEAQQAGLAPSQATYHNFLDIPILQEKTMPEPTRFIARKADDVVRKQQKVASAFNNQLLHPDIRHDALTLNRLYILNKSNDTIYLMAGEVIKGGKQDRVLAKDMIVPPSREKVELPVFCVEKNRWAYKDKDNKHFHAYSNVSSMCVRAAAQKSKSQTEVWKQIALLHEKHNIKSETNAYTALSESASYQEDLASYLQFFNHVFYKNTRVVGVVVVTGNKIVGCDIFANNKLFSQNFKNLLHSYATEALTNGNKPSIRFNTVEDYLYAFLGNEHTQDAYIKAKGDVFKVDDHMIHIATF